MLKSPAYDAVGSEKAALLSQSERRRCLISARGAATLTRGMDVPFTLFAETTMSFVFQPWHLFTMTAVGAAQQDSQRTIEYLMGSIKRDMLHKIIFVGESSLRKATVSYLEHYHLERNHQGLGNKLIEPSEEVGRKTGEVECRERLGGILRYYHRKAA